MDVPQTPYEIDITDDTADAEQEQASEIYSHELDAIKTTIIQAICENPSGSAESFAEQAGLSIKVVYRELTEMHVNGILRRVGTRKKGRWVIM